MNVHVSYKGSKPAELDKQIEQQIGKLRKRLQIFKPDLVHLRISIDDKKPPREGPNISLDLRLPSGDLAATESGPDYTTALKRAFDDLVERVTKHKDQLR